MTRFEQLQWAAIYALVHASVIVVIVEGLKIGCRAFFEREMSKKLRVGIPVLSGSSAFFVCPLVIHLMGAGEVVCLGQPFDSSFCVNQLVRASVLWWVTVSLGSLGVFSVFQLVKNDLLNLAVSRIKALGGDK